MSQKRIYRKRNDRKLAGVCSGIADYLNLDPTIVRLLWAVLTLAYGTGILIYIICALVIPEEE
ncbi:MAG TPA: PspC domain-containing protein [Clostridiaceae bacterium]|jgi:phage shock protein C|nr:PspC domain-containing protein [Clostridiaceae bacterium]HHT92490.1 PspC domain-containing protein [Clostridiaceae bacterium]